MTPSLAAWIADLETRYLSTLTFAEVARALRALSSAYVEHRGRLTSKGAFDTDGKRAAYALYYAPLHFVTVAEIIRAVGAESPARSLLDLGCGTGAAGAAWSTQMALAPRVLGIDTHPWALEQAARTYRAFGLDASTRRVPAARVRIPRHTDAIVAGWMLNEVDEATRAALQLTLGEAVRRGRRLLVVEPIATRVSPWWDSWIAPFIAAGARADEWRFWTDIPDIVRRLGHAAGLDPEAIAARSLYVMSEVGGS